MRSRVSALWSCGTLPGPDRRNGWASSGWKGNRMPSQSSHLQEHATPPLNPAPATDGTPWWGELPFKLRSLPAAVHLKLRALLHERVVESGQPVFHQDQPTDAIYWLLEGRVKITRVTPEGYESVLCVRNAGEGFCLVAALDGGPQLGTAVALGRTRLAWADRGAFHDLCCEHPELAAVVQSACLLEVRWLMHRLETFAFRSVEQRLALVLLSEMRRALEAKPPVELRLTRQELAGLAGTTRESVSRALQRLQRAGVLQARRGSVTIFDPDHLRRLVRLAPDA